MPGHFVVFTNRMSDMIRRLLTVAILFCGLLLPAYAGLSVGASAPDFTARASLGGQAFDFSLSAALKKGPVVLYFYPKAFTRGCTYEAHAFADATDKFAALGATVIGVSNDAIATLDKFSVSECSGKFAVAADPEGAVIKAYDAKMSMFLNYASRISYVIAPGGKVILAYDNLNPDEHVARTLAAVTAWRKDHP
jgi:thioredoxin-dependent peroxiredoxin